MGTIEVEERAHRLANAIIKDILLYNQAKLDSGQPMGEEIDEGRQLFCSRVRPEFHVIFESALASTPLAGRGQRPAAASFTYEHPPLIREEPAPRRTSPMIFVVALVVLAAALGAAMFILNSH